MKSVSESKNAHTDEKLAMVRIKIQQQRMKLEMFTLLMTGPYMHIDLHRVHRRK